ncbi:fasciclin domain-containing protein [Chitinophaga solisilvae]|uniref:fasciclin domain-containing protein n=1 Tax=Chitinophaga solisilvae TaxID=1233460 RepID=UPI001367DC76|nr:fasciclin domain-containing protein [Chitinophaga solisilvae]
MRLFFMPGKLLWCGLSALILCMSACRRQDIEPDPVGEPVSFNGPDKTVEQLLEKSSHTLFYTAWKRSGISEALKRKGINAVTVLAPADKALQAGGWTMDRINKATVADLDSLVRYYTSSGRIEQTSLALRPGNYALKTLLLSASIPNFDESNPYQYYMYAGRHNDSLYVNGKGVNKWGLAMEATNGTIYPIEQLIPKPETDMLTWLQADGRFTFYLEAMRISDSLYTDASWWDQQRQNLPLLSAMPMTGGSFTVFAPTNNAFIKSGFTSVEDIRQYAMRALPIGEPYSDENGYYVYPVSPMDSILLPHRMDQTGGNGPISPDRKPLPLLFFNNDMTDNKMLSGMMIWLGNIGQGPNVYVRIEFSNSNGQAAIRRLHSTHTPIPLAEKNIMLLNGLIHVVDEGLLVP